MWSRLRQALADGVVLGVKAGITLLVVAFLILWAVNDYTTVRGSAAYLRTVTDVKDAKGQPLSRMDLIDACIRDLVARQSAAAKPAPPTPPTK